MSLTKIISATTAVVVAGCAPLPKGPPISHYLNQQSPYRLVEVLSGKSDEERMQIAAKVLEAKGVPYKLEDFSTQRASGKNITFEYGHGKKVVIVSAHYDPPPFSLGANDDASCMASIIDAYELLRNHGQLKNLTVRFIFFGAEELQRQGSKAYVESANLDNIIGAASYELCGIGDSVAVWGAEGKIRGSLIVNAIEKAAKEAGIHSGVVGNIPRFYSDHVSFNERGIDSVGVTIVPKADESILRDYIKDPNAFRWVRVANRPKVFQTYHTEDDTPQTIQPEALALAAKVISKTVINLDLMLSSK